MSGRILFAFVLVDHTTSVTPTSMQPGPVFQPMIDAWLEQIESSYTDAYGDQCVSFRIASGPTDRAPNEIGIHFRDTIPEAPGALAYHTVVNGIPDIELGVDLFTDLVGARESVSSGGSHELLELLGDAGANQWADRQDGSGQMDARENCDFVQNTGYPTSNGVYVSNFVFSSVFIPGAVGPYDAMGVMTSQYDVSNGYGIQGNAPQNISQIGGSHFGMHRNAQTGLCTYALVGHLTEAQIKRKSNPYSRTHRRGVRLAQDAAIASGFSKVVP